MNRLTRLADFQKVLSDYRISGSSKQVLKDTELVVLTGLSSSGRNTIIRELEKEDAYYFVVSDTTRKPRENNGVLEQNGREYWFRTELEILEDLKAGKLLEAEVIHGQQVSGISIRELHEATKQNKVALADMDIGGALNVLEAKPNAVVILVLPPTFKVWLARMNGRGHMPAEEQRRRLETADRILKIALSDDRFIFLINHDHYQSAGYVDKVAHDPRAVENDRQTEGRQVAEQLLTDTKEFLKS